MLIPLLAFGFANPWLLWGLGLAAIPVLIHLFYKRRYRETSWAAMRFLLAASQKNSRRLRIEQLLLLAVRMLILALAALALARPQFETLAAPAQALPPTQRIIVVDASFSMGLHAGDGTVFDRAKAAARAVVNESRKGDPLNLVRICNLPPQVVVKQQVYRTEQALGEIDQLQVSEAPGDVEPALAAIIELLKEAPEIKQKQVTIISDFQRHNWAPELPGRSARVRALLKSISEAAQLKAVDVGRSEASNVAITAFNSKEPFAVQGREFAVNATLHNFGKLALPAQKVEMSVDGRLAKTVPLDLPAEGDAVAAFTYSVPVSGEHRLEVRLSDDDLPIDNRRFLSLPVKEQLNVLLVNGKPSGRAVDDATFYLKTALSPSTAAKPWQGLVRPQVIKEGELAGTDLNPYDCVMLANIALFNAGEARLLESYVRGGGGLIVWLGDQVQADNYNVALYRDGEGLLPAKLGKRVGGPDQEFAFDTGDLSHPISRPFNGNPGTGLESAMTFEYLQATATERKSAKVALRFSSGDPAIAEATVGRGRVILVTTSADTRWGLWPVQPSFPPIVQELVRFAVSGRWSERGRLVGEPIIRTVPARAAGKIMIRRPGGRDDSVVLPPSDDFASLVYEATDRSGIYEILYGEATGNNDLVAVNVDPRESNLARLSDDEIKAEFKSKDSTAAAQMPLPEAGTLQNEGPLARGLLGIVLVLLLAEQLMSWRFAYGVAFLLLAGTAIAVGKVYGLPVAAAVVFGVLALAAAWLLRSGTTTRNWQRTS